MDIITYNENYVNSNKYLLENLKFYNNYKDKYGNNAYLLAARNEHLEIMKYLESKEGLYIEINI